MGEASVLSVSATDRDIPVVLDPSVTYESVGFRGTTVSIPLPEFRPDDQR